jgi:hypothetical protein
MLGGAPGLEQLGGWPIIEKRATKFFSNGDNHFHFWSLAISPNAGQTRFFFDQFVQGRT